MSAFYELTGSVSVVDRPEVWGLVRKFNGENSAFGIQADFDFSGQPGFLTIEFFGSAQMSHDRIGELDGIVREFGPYATAPTMVDYICDGDAGKLYVGPASEEDATVSKDAQEQILGLLHLLTPGDLLSLKAVVDVAVEA